MLIHGPRIIVAMDFDNATECLTMARRLSPRYCRLKVGKELFTSCGPSIVSELMGLGFEVFLDLKFHDIPTTTAKAVEAAANLGVWMVNVHASGGERMLLSAREALDRRAGQRPILIAVTLLTSMEASDMVNVGIERSPEDHVISLATLAHRCGIDGVVCSAQEAPVLRTRFGSELCLVTPGIRLASSPIDDQRRTLTPAAALSAGSSFLVIGRPITRANDPEAVCQEILASLN